MSYSVIVHMLSDEPIEGEMDEMPPPNATFIAIKKPRKRGNRDLEWIDHHTNTLMLSVAQLVSVEFSLAHGEHDLVTKTGFDLRYVR